MSSMLAFTRKQTYDNQSADFEAVERKIHFNQILTQVYFRKALTMPECLNYICALLHYQGQAARSPWRAQWEKEGSLLPSELLTCNMRTSMIWLDREETEGCSLAFLPALHKPVPPWCVWRSDNWWKGGRGKSWVQGALFGRWVMWTSLSRCVSLSLKPVLVDGFINKNTHESISRLIKNTNTL